MRRCTCDKGAFEPWGGDPDKQCRRCWLFHNDPQVHQRDGGNDPSLLAKATNLVKAMVSWAASGFAMASEDQAKKRLSICQTNKCGFYNANDTCKHIQCGCYLKYKTTILNQKCPVGRW